MLRIVTRDSDLALWQARHVQHLLTERLNTPSELLPVKTRGDLDLSTPLSVLEGKGFFTKELEHALLDHGAELAVHSLKDLPTRLPPGLKIAAILSRADRREALLIRREARFEREPFPVRPGGVIGTSSTRRLAQVRILAPDLELKDIRGNVPGRVRKLRDGDYDAILLAWAGLSRLGLDLSDLDVALLPPDRFLPAPGQGALAIEIRDDDPDTEAVVAQLDDPAVRLEVDAERGLLHLFAGGCNLPLGVHAEGGNDVHLQAVYAAFNPRREWFAFRTNVRAASPEEAAAQAFSDLLRQKLAWAQEHKPLAGLTVAVTRPADRVAALRKAVESIGGKLLAVPTLAFEAAGDPDELKTVCEDLPRFDWLFFTSANAVHFCLESRQLPCNLPEGLRIGTIGEATARAVREAGFEVHFVGEGTGGDFADRFLAEVGAGRRILWPTAAVRREELPRRLIAAGVRIEPVVVYRATLPPVEARLAPELVQPDWVLVTSPQAGRNFVDLYGAPEGAKWAAIGPITQAEMQSLLRVPVTVAREASLEALAEVLV